MMPTTPERARAESETSRLQFDELSPGSTPDHAGELIYADGGFKLRDSVGVFNPRAVALHAPTHSKGGSDQVNAQDLGSGVAPTGKLLQSDGAGGWNLVDYVPGFPPNLETDSTSTPFSTSSSSYQQAWRYTTAVLPAGSYFFAVQADLDTTNAGNVTDCRAQVDDAETIANTIGPVGYVGGSRPLVGVRSVAFPTVAAHTVDFDIRKASGNGSVSFKSIRVTLWRIA